MMTVKGFPELQCPAVMIVRFSKHAKQVQIFDFTMHWVQGRLTSKLAASLLFRRGLHGHTLLAALIRDHRILKVTADGLSKLLDAYAVRMRRNSSKSAKIRGLMATDEIREFCTDEELAALDKALDEHDKKRRKMKVPDNVDGEEEDAQEATRLQTVWTPPVHPLFTTH